MGSGAFSTKDIAKIKALSTINARSEMITEAKTWREPVKKRRCLVPVSGFYEWDKFAKAPKQPYAFQLSAGGLLHARISRTPGGTGEGIGCNPSPL